MIKHLRLSFSSISGAKMFLHEDERLKVMVAVSISSAVNPHVYQAIRIYLAYGLSNCPTVENQSNSIVMTAGEIAWLQDTWKKCWNRPPDVG